MLDFGVILSNLSDPLTLLLMMGSASFGIIMGAIPGLSGTLGIALLLPFTFSVEPHQALLMLGSYGIAVGMRTQIMPHNFTELLQAQIAELHGEEYELYPDFL